MRFVVVGGGATGLVAAIELARRGREVTVLESSAHLGGRAQSLDAQGRDAQGFVMNLGPHALYAHAERRLRELGVSVTGGTPKRGLTMQFGDRLAELPANARSLLGSAGLAWRGKARFASLLGRLAWLDAERLDGVSVNAWLDELGMRGSARRLLLATLRLSTYVNAPDLLSAGAAIRQLRAALEGVRYVDDGWGAIVRGLSARASSLGVVVQTGARVQHLETQRGLVKRVHFRSGESIPARGVVLTLSPKACRRLLGESASNSLTEFASTAVAVRAACLDVALRELPRRHPALILGTDEPTYLSIHSNVSRLAPEGGGLIHVARYLEPGERVGAHTRADLERRLDDAQPGWRETLVSARWAPAMTVMHAIPEARFGGFGGRPAATGTGLANVALAGDWVGPERFLFDACLASARAAAESLLKLPARREAGLEGGLRPAR